MKEELLRKELRGRLENAVALSADFHTHKRYEEFYQRFGSQIGGFTGIYDLIITMAQAMGAPEDTREDYWGDSNFDWPTVCEVYVDTMIVHSLREGSVQPAHGQLNVALDKLKATYSKEVANG